jgi:prepilin signal peptidase PulO-like enzyme (type II secretory pathway)
MDALFYILTFISGLFFGSFLNLVADRSVRGESILFGRSHCEKCNTTLTLRDLIPLLSFGLAKGKCRHCSDKLSGMYPLSEFITGLAFVGVAYISGVFKFTGTTFMDTASVVSFLFLLVVVCFFIVLFLTDIKYRLIPNNVVIPGIIFILLFLIGSAVYISITNYFGLKDDPLGKYLLQVGYWHSQVLAVLRTLSVYLISAFLIGFFFWFLVFITKGRGMGGGDIKLAVMIGLFNGFPANVLAIFLGFFFGAVYSILMIVIRQKTVKDTIAFGPFLIIGSLVAFVFGDDLIRIYLNSF